MTICDVPTLMNVAEVIPLKLKFSRVGPDSRIE